MSMSKFRTGGRMNHQDIAAVQEAEETILLAGEQLNEALFQRYTDGELSSQDLQSVYNRVREWARLSEELLKLLTPC
jgi:hypothetical protein